MCDRAAERKLVRRDQQEGARDLRMGMREEDCQNQSSYANPICNSILYNLYCINKTNKTRNSVSRYKFILCCLK